MILVRDQNKQGNRTKSFDSQLLLHQDTPKQTFPGDSKDHWENECEGKPMNSSKDVWGLSCEEELLTSDNDTEEEDNYFEEYPEQIHESRGKPDTFGWKKPFKNVRFEGSEFNYVLDTSETSSLENENSGTGHCVYQDYSHKPVLKMTDNPRMPSKSKWINVECYDMKYERRPKSSPEKSNGYLDVEEEGRPLSLEDYGDITESRQRMRRKQYESPARILHAEGDPDHVCGELINRKSRYNLDYSQDLRQQRQEICCSTIEETKKKTSSKPRSIHKHHFCTINDSSHDPEVKVYNKSYRDNRPLQVKQLDVFPYHSKVDHHCTPSEHLRRGKKKTLEVVQEQHEHLSDSTYRIPCSKFSSHTVPNESKGCRRSHERMTNSSQSDWLYCSARNSLDKMLHSYKFHKIRSRRTRMNRLINGWKKAFVQTVRDGNRNERVGVILMGPKGPEFYSKNTQQPLTGADSFGNKSSDIIPKSFDVMTVDCKNVYLSSSEPRTYPTDNLPLPEDETKVDEKLANFSKNVSDIVKTSEERFYKALSGRGHLDKNKTPPDLFSKLEQKEPQHPLHSKQHDNDEEKENMRKPPFQVLQLENLSPTTPKSLRKRERKFNQESKAMADALNKQAKDYKENQLKLKDNDTNYKAVLKQLQQEYPPKQISPETAKANLSVWGMTSDHLTPREDCKKEQGDGDDNKFNRTEPPQKTNSECQVPAEGGKIAMDETSQTALDQFITPQKTKKFYETAAGDGTCIGLSPAEPTSKRLAATTATIWTACTTDLNQTTEEVQKSADPNLISEMFRDLVEHGCAISQEESENLQSFFGKVNAEACSNDAISQVSSELLLNTNGGKGTVSETEPGARTKVNKITDEKLIKEDKQGKKPQVEMETCLEDTCMKKMVQLKTHLDNKIFKKNQSKGKSKKKVVLFDKMKVLREALPSIAAENEAAHLKQLKKYIERFIERIEASTSSEFENRKQNMQKVKDVMSTDSSEVRVDARKILDIVNNPFKTVSSDVTINIAKKLTDALVQEKTNKGSKSVLGKVKKPSEAETDDESFPQCPPTSSSGKFSPEKFTLKVDPFLTKTNFLAVITYGFMAVCGVIFLVNKYQLEDSEPTYLKQLKKMRNQHLNNIVLEVKKLSDLLRFLDRCNRITF